MATLVFSQSAMAGTVIVKTSHQQLSDLKQLPLYGQMMVKTNHDPMELPEGVFSEEYRDKYPKKLSVEYDNISDFQIKWIGLNSVDMKNFKQIDLHDCEF